eukprot:TRINITY_DN669_c0_g1_i1.p1 TRINITY_DN669_c0_g1~~TRINITY_DN669_c0_g1_i1.p1  ORF type:complete len:443 (+),score=96.27 TRINITY_DN669_c0_g1_i1:3-1331(+)
MKTIQKIKITNPIVEMEGDDLSKILSEKIKTQLLDPHLSLPLLTFDLSLASRVSTSDLVTKTAILALKQHSVGIKGPTKMPQRSVCAGSSFKDSVYFRDSVDPMGEIFNRRDVIGSDRSCGEGKIDFIKNPDVMIRGHVGGSVFTEFFSFLKGKKSIILGSLASGDEYGAVETYIPYPGKLDLIYTSENGQKIIKELNVFDSVGGVGLATFNANDSAKAFAHSCFRLALKRSYPVYFSTKNPSLPDYDGKLRKIFDEVYITYAEAFDRAGLSYSHKPTGSMMAFALNCDGGFIWATNSYDGDLALQVLGSGFGCLGTTIRVLIADDDKTLQVEPAHGTFRENYVDHLMGKETTTNPIAYVLSWCKALRHRAKLDDNPKLSVFCDLLEETCNEAVANGFVPNDLVLALDGGSRQGLSTDDFIQELQQILKHKVLLAFDKKSSL